MEIIFVDKDPDVIRTYQKIIGNKSYKRKHYFICCDINRITTMYEDIDYIVSPANSYGIMNGGIDEVYMLMFPGIENKVKKAIREKYPETKELPVGECLSVPIEKMRRCRIPSIKELICCPTMRVPSDINGTDNIYLAMKGLLDFLKLNKRPIKVVIPGLGTLTGKLPFEESAEQIKRALDE